MDNAIIQVEDLVKVFGGRVPVRALDGLSLTVGCGGVYGLLGPNGAGKTTLIRVLATLLEPDRGRVRVAGIDVRHHPEQVRARIGLAGQSAAVDDHLTGRENVEMVGGAVLELTVPEADRAHTLQAVRALRAEGPAEDRHHGRIVVPAPHGAATLAEALRRLHAAGVTPEDVALHKPTLDDVFLALTGHLATTPSGYGHDTPGGGDRRGQQQHERTTR